MEFDIRLLRSPSWNQDCQQPIRQHLIEITCAQWFNLILDAYIPSLHSWNPICLDLFCICLLVQSACFMSIPINYYQPLNLILMTWCFNHNEYPCLWFYGVWFYVFVLFYLSKPGAKSFSAMAPSGTGPRPSAMDAFPARKTFWLPGRIMSSEQIMSSDMINNMIW